LSNIVLVVANLDPHHRQTGYLDLDLEELGLDKERSYQAHDLLTEARYLWQGSRSYVELDPNSTPAHVLLVRRRVRTEKHFDYFM
jgi:starch synthase (maltosyl-transferring)